MRDKTSLNHQIIDLPRSAYRATPTISQKLFAGVKAMVKSVAKKAGQTIATKTRQVVDLARLAWPGIKTTVTVIAEDVATGINHKLTTFARGLLPAPAVAG